MINVLSDARKKAELETKMLQNRIIMIRRAEERMELKIKKTEIFSKNIANAQQINRERVASIEREELLRDEERKERQINAYN